LSTANSGYNQAHLSSGLFFAHTPRTTNELAPISPTGAEYNELFRMVLNKTSLREYFAKQTVTALIRTNLNKEIGPMVYLE